MMHERFSAPLSERMAKADARRRRYRTDPDYRLRAINRYRRNAGKPLLASLAESRKLFLPMDGA